MTGVAEHQICFQHLTFTFKIVLGLHIYCIACFYISACARWACLLFLVLFLYPTEDACCYCLTVVLFNFNSYSEIFRKFTFVQTCGGNHMIVTDLLVLLTVMANSANDYAMGFPETRDCLNAGQDANGTNTCSKNNIESGLLEF